FPTTAPTSTSIYPLSLHDALPILIRAFESFVDDVSNWYIRRSRRRFYSLDEAAFATLWYALVQSLRVIAPVMPFLSDHLWRNLRSEEHTSELQSPDHLVCRLLLEQ